MTILAIESSCDETGVAIVKKNTDNQITIIAHALSSSLSLHAKTGGIIPEVAAREQLGYIIPALSHTLEKAGITNFKTQIDAIAVTVGPGLIGSLLVGVETAKTLAICFDKPIIPVNHLFGHIYANWISYAKNSTLPTLAKHNFESALDSSLSTQNSIVFPAIALVVSGGHTDLIVINNHEKITWLGGTRDDAAGEAFDKIGRLLNLPYPAGPLIAKKAAKGNPNAFIFPRPLIHSNDYDFSFSGLKTAVFREIQHHDKSKLYEEPFTNDICASVQAAIVEVLVAKTLKAAKEFSGKSILLGGGVAANEILRTVLINKAKQSQIFAKIFIPEKSLCTDNAAMIGAHACFLKERLHWSKVSANPQLYFD